MIIFSFIVNNLLRITLFGFGIVCLIYPTLLIISYFLKDWSTPTNFELVFGLTPFVIGIVLIPISIIKIKKYPKYTGYVLYAIAIFLFVPFGIAIVIGYLRSAPFAFGRPQVHASEQPAKVLVAAAVFDQDSESVWSAICFGAATVRERLLFMIRGPRAVSRFFVVRANRSLTVAALTGKSAGPYWIQRNFTADGCAWRLP